MNKSVHIKSIHELKSFLSHHWVPLEKYGTWKANSIEKLYREIAEWESILEFNTTTQTISRRVKVINACVYYRDNNNDQFLIEEKQVYTKTPQERRRVFEHCSFSEKFKHKESPDIALFRWCKEELGLILEENQFQRKTQKEEIILAFSDTYPWIMSMYETHYYEVILTSKQYNPQWYKEVLPEKTTYFTWKDLE